MFLLPFPQLFGVDFVDLFSSLVFLDYISPVTFVVKVWWCSNYCTIAHISHASKVMLKILQARLQLYINCELPVVQAGFRKGRGTRYQIANIFWITEKAREFQKNIYFCFIDYAKAFDCLYHNKLENSEEMGIPDHLTCFLKNLYEGQEATFIFIFLNFILFLNFTIFYCFC